MLCHKSETMCSRKIRSATATENVVKTLHKSITSKEKMKVIRRLEGWAITSLLFVGI
jgi:hypothetical protein